MAPRKTNNRSTKQQQPKSTTPTVKAPADAGSHTAGHMVHYHPAKDAKPAPESALAAMVLHMTDAATGRADLQVHHRNGEVKVVPDVLASAERTAGHWCERSRP